MATGSTPSTASSAWRRSPCCRAPRRPAPTGRRSRRQSPTASRRPSRTCSWRHDREREKGTLMPEYLAPGVYVEEVDTGTKPIEGVSTSTAGMVGVADRGPVNEATLVTGLADFYRRFGGFLDRRSFPGPNWLLPHAVDGFL